VAGLSARLDSSVPGDRRDDWRRPTLVINEVLPRFFPAAEVEVMTQTIADYYVEQGVQKGMLRGKRNLLLRQLESRFGQLPESVKEKVLSLQEDDALDDLSVRVLSAERLEDLALS